MARVCRFCRDPATFITRCTACDTDCCDGCTVLIWCDDECRSSPFCFACESRSCEECNEIERATFKCAMCSLRFCVSCCEEYGDFQGGLFVCTECQDRYD